MSQLKKPESQLSLNLQLQELLDEAPTLENRVHTSLLAVSFKYLHLLQPTFPEDIQDDALTEAIVRERHHADASKLAKVVFSVANVFPPRGRNTSHISFSPDFTSYYRSVSGTPAGADPQMWLDVSETSYDGVITVDGQQFSFDTDHPVCKATSAWLDSDGRHFAASVDYLHTPDGAVIGSALPDKITMPFVDPGASRYEAMSSIIEAAATIPR
jgi:hypothetical protein